MTFDQIFAIAAGVILIAGILYAIRPKWSFEVVADQSGVRSYRGLPKLHQATIIDFLQKEIPLEGRICIRGQRQKDGHVRLHVIGALDAGSRQRIRNFLLAHL